MSNKSKDYLSINEITEHIKSKNIKIRDEVNLKQILELNNYYYITGYKELLMIKK